MTAFAFATAGMIRFGRGEAVTAVPSLVALGARVLLVTGATPQRAAWLKDALEAEGVSVTVFPVAKEPDVALIESGVAAAREAQAERAVVKASAVYRSRVAARESARQQVELIRPWWNGVSNRKWR